MVAVPPLRIVQANSANSCKGAIGKSYGAERLQGVHTIELNASEATEDVSRKQHECENQRERLTIGISSAKDYLRIRVLPPPALRRQDYRIGYVTELGKLLR